MEKFIYLAFVASAIFLLHGCAIGSLDFTDNRSILIEHNGTRIEIKGDIIAIEDYTELNKLLREVKKCQNR